MAKFRKKPVEIDAITFDELVEYGKVNGGHIVNGMPWSFSYKGHPITQENDECYLIPTLEGIHNMTPKDMLITGVQGEIYPCKLGIFEQTYESNYATQEGKEMTLWQRIKFVSSEMGKWLWPFIKMFMSAAAPILASAATQAVGVVAEYGLTSDEDKKREAFKLIEADLKHQGITIGTQVTVSMINGAIEAAVQNMKSN